MPVVKCLQWHWETIAVGPHMSATAVWHAQIGAESGRCRRNEVIYFSRRIREDFTEEVAAYGFVGPLRVNDSFKSPLYILLLAACFRVQSSEMSRCWRLRALAHNIERSKKDWGLGSQILLTSPLSPQWGPKANRNLSFKEWTLIVKVSL